MKDKKVLLKFIGTMLACAAVGAVVGFGASHMRHNIYEAVEKMSQYFYNNIFVFSIVVFVALTALMLYFSGKGKRLMKDCAGDENEASAEADKALSIAMGTCSVANIVMFMLMGIKFAAISADISEHVPGLFAYVVLFLVEMFFLTFMQMHIFNVIKKMNPQKRGNVLDTKFQKEWFESMDEAEKFATYESTYHAHMQLQKAFPAAMAVIMLMTLIFRTGPLAILAVGALWGIQTVTYIAATMHSPRKGTPPTGKK